MNVAILSFDHPGSACARYRVQTPLAHDSIYVAWAVTNDGETQAIDGDALQAADIIIVQRFFPLEVTEPVLETCFASGKPVIYEADDLITDLPNDHPQFALAQRTLTTLERLSKKFDLITVSTHELKRAFQPLNSNIEVIPNRLPPTGWPRPTVSAHDAPTRVLYAGTPTHTADIAAIEKPLLDVMERHGESMELILFGCGTPALEKHPMTQWIAPTTSYDDYVAKITKTPFDIGLAPLTDTPFNRVKSHVKWIEYTACGAAGIYSDLPPYHPIRDGIDGLLVSDSSQWAKTLNRLIAEPEKRAALAQNAWDTMQAAHMGPSKELLNICYKLAGKNPAS